MFLSNVAGTYDCTTNAHFAMAKRRLSVLDDLMGACVNAVHNKCVSCGMVNHSSAHPNTAGGKANVVRHVVTLSPTGVSGCRGAVTHVGKARRPSCNLRPQDARFFHNSCALRRHPRCAVSLHLISAHATHGRCLGSGNRNVGRCFVSSNSATVVMGKGRCCGVFPM